MSGVLIVGPLFYPPPPRCADCGFIIDADQKRTVRYTMGPHEDPRKEGEREYVLWSCCRGKMPAPVVGSRP